MREAFAFKGGTRGGSAAEASSQGTERTARLEHGVGSLMSERLTRSSRRVTKVAARSRAGMQADGRQVAVGGGAAARERRDKRGLALAWLPCCPALLAVPVLFPSLAMPNRLRIDFPSRAGIYSHCTILKRTEGDARYLSAQLAIGLPARHSSALRNALEPSEQVVARWKHNESRGSHVLSPSRRTRPRSRPACTAAPCP
jgi:hypothetical protein